MISSLMEYEGYHAKIEFDQEDQIFVGHVLGINDSINFHGQSVQELTVEFHNSVNNYIDYCAQIGKEPEREFKGSFNVRIKPEQHKKVALHAANEGITINQFVSRAIDDELSMLEGMKIKQIFDGDYGCEELQQGQKPKVSVTLVDDAGNEKLVSVEDDWLTENGLDIGSEWPKEI